MFENEEDNPIFNEEETFGNEPEEEIDFYAILNVPREATVTEIEKAYKQRCLIFHPDRHLDEEDRREAQKMFVELRKAYETLTNPQLRTIYDALGVRGIDMQGWQLIDRSTNPQNIRKEYEFLKRLRENEIMLNRVHPSSNFMVKTSLKGWCQEERYFWPELVGMRLSQGVDMVLLETHRAGLISQVGFNEAGVGDGFVQFSYKRPFLPPYANMEAFFAFSTEVLALSPKLTLTNHSEDIFLINKHRFSAIIVQPTLRYSWLRNFYQLPVSVVLVCPLMHDLHGSFKLGFDLLNRKPTSFGVSIVYTELTRPKFTCNINLSMSPNLRLSYHHYWPSDAHFEGRLKLGVIEITPEISYERRLTRYSRFGVNLLFSWPACLLQLDLRVRTSLNNYEFCFLFCDNQEEFARLLPNLMFPMIAMSFAGLLLKRPLQRLAKRIFGDRTSEEGINESRKEQAQRVVHLMREAAERIAREEERKKGLVILEALYGEMLNDAPGAELYPVAGERLIDVAVPLQALVNDSQLRLYSGKDQIPGFYDPCPGEPKMLKVSYQFHDQLHSVTVREEQPLMLPMRSHRVAMEGE